MSDFDQFILEGTNPQQQEVILHAYGPALVIAGAGSGKTSSLTRRTAKLIMDGVRPDSILLLTFTNKAAHEMMSRVESLLGIPKLPIQGGTFHSYAYKQLMRYSSYLYPDLFEKGSYRCKQIIDASDADKLIGACLTQIMTDRGIGKEQKSQFKSGYLYAQISLAKNKMIPLTTLLAEDYMLTGLQREVFLEAAELYESHKERNLYYDFDDILIDYLKLLQIDEIREAACGYARQIMLDEYQDTNPLQFALVKELYKVSPHILVVGDDAQSIYAFRGADYKNILSFPSQFPDVKLIMLTQNYRSAQNILDVGNAVVADMSNKFDKVLTAAKKHQGHILHWTPRTSYEQADNIVALVRQRLADGVPYSDIAVLSRSAAHTFEIESAFVKAQIPFVKWGGLRFFDKAHVKDLIAIIRMKLSKTDKISALRVFGLIPSVGAKTAEKFFEEWQRNTLGTFLGKKKNFAHGAHIMELVEELDESQDKGALFQMLLDLYRPLCQAQYKDDYLDRMTELEEMKAVLMSASSFAEFVALTALASAGEQTANGAVVISTIHAVKGLEFDTVVVINVLNDCLPFARAETDDDIEEERRLMYVAVTRSKQVLIMSTPSTIQLFGETQVMRPSMFFTEAIKAMCARRITPPKLVPF